MRAGRGPLEETRTECGFHHGQLNRPALVDVKNGPAIRSDVKISQGTPGFLGARRGDGVARHGPCRGDGSS